LNHGSFGACPAPVLKVQDDWRREWLAQPDALFFSGTLQAKLSEAAVSVIPGLTSCTDLSADQVCLVENATVATLVLAWRWRKLLRPGDVVLVLSVTYGASLNILREYCEHP
ncbi:unnamed protein product, partial [Polarella glacialis]